MGKRQKETEKKHRIQALHIIQGAGLIVVLTCVFVFGAAWMIENGMLREEMSDWIIRTICFISPIFVGMFQRKRFGGYAAIEGMLSALFSGMFLAGIGILIWGKFSVGKGIWNILLFILGGGLFGILTGNKKKRRKN